MTGTTHLDIHAHICRTIERIKFNMPSERAVIECAAQACGTTYEDVMNGSRAREIVQARQLATVYFLSNYRISLNKVGAIIKRDHATALHLHRRYSNLMDVNDSYLVSCRAKFINLILQRDKDNAIEMKRYQRLHKSK